MAANRPGQQDEVAVVPDIDHVRAPYLGPHHGLAAHPLGDQADVPREARLQPKVGELGVPRILTVHDTHRVRHVVVAHRPDQQALAILPLAASVPPRAIVVFLERNEEGILPPEEPVRLYLRERRQRQHIAEAALSIVNGPAFPRDQPTHRIVVPESRGVQREGMHAAERLRAAGDRKLSAEYADLFCYPGVDCGRRDRVGAAPGRAGILQGDTRIESTELQSIAVRGERQRTPLEVSLGEIQAGTDTVVVQFGDDRRIERIGYAQLVVGKRPANHQSVAVLVVTELTGGSFRPGRMPRRADVTDVRADDKRLPRGRIGCARARHGR